MSVFAAEKSHQITKYAFDKTLPAKLVENAVARQMWPLVYLISDEQKKEIYIGETTDALARMSNHLNNTQRNNLADLRLITCELFNKSATLDIESNLIKYISGDGKYKLQNGNAGLARHNYYQKREYQQLFRNIWDDLRKEKIAVQAIEKIDNSDLFKYSPYKSLSNDQLQGVLEIAKALLSESSNTILVEGGAGTGKTVLAIYLFKLMHSEIDFDAIEESQGDDGPLFAVMSKLKKKFPNPSMALVVPMSSLRGTLQKAFKNIKGLSPKMVINPADLTRNPYDIIIVDEAHRLRRRANLGAYYGAFDNANRRMNLPDTATELDWALRQSTKQVLFYDQNQSIKPSDVRPEDFAALKKKKSTKHLRLVSQLRVQGGNDYVAFVHDLLDNDHSRAPARFESPHYDLKLFEDISDFIEAVRAREKEFGLSRFAAGFAWPWISRDDKQLFDIEIDGVRLQWNGTTEDWINSETAAEEVGCIHTTQGYDLNYIGLILGPEITYDRATKRVQVIAEKYFDRNGKQSIADPEELRAYILNIYKTMLLRGIRGTYIFVCDMALRKYFKQFVPTDVTQAAPPRPKLHLLPRSKVKPYEDAIPVFDIKAAAGDFSDGQISDSPQWVAFDRPNKHYFALQVIGESMNNRIPNGSWCLFRLHPEGTRQNKIVLVQLRNFEDPENGGRYTIKRYESAKTQSDEDSWRHTTILLKPESTDPGFTPVRLNADQEGSLLVIAEFVKILA